MSTDLLSSWYAAKQELKELRDREAQLRKLAIAYYFPELAEGMNTFNLPDDFQLKADSKINRKVDGNLIPTISKEMRNAFNVDIDTLIRYKPELKMAAYRKLTDEQKKCFDQLLTISQGSISLEIK